MKHFDQTTAACQVFTYKEGVLSALAFDLRIIVSSFVVDLGGNETTINARFDADSFHVDCAMADGSERKDLLSDKSKKEIDRIILKDVLDAANYRTITFSSRSVTKEGSSYRIKGALDLHGISREITFTVRNEDHYYVAEAWLNLPEFGIKPFSAYFGAIKIKPDILIRTKLPLKES